MFLIILLYALFGASFPISKKILTFIDPIFYTGIRMVIAGTILLLYQYFYGHHKFSLKWRNAIYYAQIIIFGVYLTYILRFWGLHHLTATKTAFLFNIAPFFSALYSYLFFKEKLTKLQWFGLTLGFLGFIPMLLTSSPTEKLFGEIFIFSWWELAVLGAVACQSYSWIIMRKLIREKNYAPTMINGFSMFVGGCIALATSLLFEGAQTMADPGSLISWLAIVIIISNIVCHNLYAHLLRKYSATFLSFAGFLGPLFSAFYSWVFLSEKITWHFFASASIVFVGLFMFYRHEFEVAPIEDIE